MKSLIIAILLTTTSFANDSFVKKYTHTATCIFQVNNVDSCVNVNNAHVVVFNYKNTSDIFLASGGQKQYRFFNLGKTDSAFKTKGGTSTQIIKAVDEDGTMLTIQFADDLTTKSSFLRLLFTWGYLEFYGE
jgi:hypothetical protein